MGPTKSVHEVPISPQALADLVANDPDAYAEWLVRWRLDKKIRTIPAPRTRSVARNYSVGRGQVVIQGSVVEAKDFTRRIGEFLTAVTGPKVDEETFNLRIQECRSCEHIKVRDRKTFFSGQEVRREYCGVCGCPKWRLAALDKKLRFARLECPIGKWPAVETES